MSSDSTTTLSLYSMLDDRLSFHRQSKSWISLEFDVNVFFSLSIVFHSPPSTYLSRALASATPILDSSSGPTSHATFLKSFNPYARRLHGYLVKEQMSLATMFVVNEVVIANTSAVEKFKTRDSIDPCFALVFHLAAEKSQVVYGMKQIKMEDQVQLAIENLGYRSSMLNRPLDLDVKYRPERAFALRLKHGRTFRRETDPPSNNRTS